MATISREVARTIVNTLRKKNGGLGPEQRQLMDKEALEIIDSLREQLGGSVQTLATNLYTTDTRFVFELIQNAEDNHYTKAKSANENPFLSFTIYPDRIILDSNEDGFTQENVTAICSITKSGKVVSSKSDAQRQQGYIGEKGIGFKSVFKVASKVHIQSEPFSFCFEYNRQSPEETGMGMVTPFFVEHNEVPEGVRTRMILSLASSANFDNLVKQFSDPDHLPDSLLIFLSQIHRLTILVYDAVGIVSKTTYSYRFDSTERRGTLTKSSLEDILKVNYYHVTKRTLQNLPRDALRENKPWAEVVLAFPIDSNSTPVIKQQHVFAYLPMRQVGFSFLIQSDFVTQASREDLFQSPRNEAILDGVAATFRDAVLQFCNHPTLRFEWMRYLPSKNISESFWAKLLPKIITLLKDSSVLLTHSGKIWKSPSQLKWLPESCKDDHGEPLFDDLPTELYLSSGYQWCDKPALETLCLQTIHIQDIVDRVCADLRSPKSKFKSFFTTQSWHERSANVLMIPFKSNNEWVANQIRLLPLVPLLNGDWAATGISRPTFGNATKQIYYPYNDGVPVPTDLDISLVDPSSLQVASRKALFSLLGVKDCEPKEVVRRIIGKYNKWNAVDLHHSIKHLRYLYWNLPKEQETLDKSIYVKDQANEPVYRAFMTFGKQDLIVDDLYFESEDLYGASRLLKEVKSGDKIVVPKFPAHFINEKYMDAVSSKARNKDLSWKDWLEKFAEVRSIPRLVSRKDTAKLSAVFAYVIEKKAGRVIGTLKAHWGSYSSLMNKDVVQEISQASVPCDDVADTPLGKTYMPLPKLQKRCSKLGVQRAVPFLKLPTELNLESLAEWDFLKTFHVRYEADLDFYVNILHHFTGIAGVLSDQERCNLFTVYEELGKHSKASDYPWLREVFAEAKTVYVPDKVAGTAQWATLSRCLWQGPAFLDEWFPLAGADSYRNNDKLKHLFTVILEIGNAGWSHSLTQIAAEKQRPEPLVDMSSIYHHILKEGPNDQDWEVIRNRFKDDELVYVLEEKSWLPPSSCLWAKKSNISDKSPIALQYSNLGQFFVDKLLVEEPNIAMLVQELKDTVIHNEPPTIQATKGLIEELNSYGPCAPALDDLKDYPILPVKDTNGQTKLRKPTDAFVIIDNMRYFELFGNKVPILDYTREEAHGLNPFVSALGLEGKYMSQLVQEVSMARSESRHPALSKNIREKAYAIARCACHYKVVDSQDRSLYDRFNHVELYESDEIVKTVTISLDGLDPVTVHGEKAKLHIEKTEDRLKIYVPKDEKEFELCFLKVLPGKLANHLGIQELSAVEVLGNVLKASRVSILGELLEEYNIVQLPWPEPIQQNAPSDQFPAGDEEDLGHARSSWTLEQPSLSRAVTPELSHSTHQRDFSSTVPLGSRTVSAYDLGVRTPVTQSFTESSYGRSGFTSATPSFTGSFNTPRSSLTPAPVSVRAEATPVETIPSAEYIALLDYVIAVAAAATRRDLDLPPLTEVPEPVELSDSLFGKRSENQIAHDIKIGAAGELYAFECLLNHGLPNFGRENWKSNIRKTVCVHEKYKDMEEWKGPETADIVYEDDGPNYVLSNSFSEYLPKEGLKEGARIKYYLEVKTTTEECGSRFFVSKAQYRRMHRMALDPAKPATEVYVILRVYNLGRENMDMRIYVDPATLRRQKRLVFEAESYSVSMAVSQEHPWSPR